MKNMFGISFSRNVLTASTMTELFFFSSSTILFHHADKCNRFFFVLFFSRPTKYTIVIKRTSCQKYEEEK